jgi:hypothetical protein
MLKYKKSFTDTVYLSFTFDDLPIVQAPPLPFIHYPPPALVYLEIW